MAKSSRPLTMNKVAVRDITVESIRDITPKMRRIRLTGPDLLGVERNGNTFGAFNSAGFDDHVKFIVPDIDGTPVQAHAEPGSERALSDEGRVAARDYSIRAQGEGWIDVDVVRHEGGRVATWAERTQPGDKISIAGPRANKGFAPGIDWFLLIADETGLPAVGRFIDEAAAGTHAIVLLEVASEAEIQQFPNKPGIEVHWLVRADTPAGYSTVLLDKLVQIEFPDGRGFAWGAAEAVTMTSVRRYVAEIPGIADDDVDIRGYWRRSEEVEEVNG